MVRPIMLSPGARLEIEDNNYILKYKVETKDGSARWSVGGYFPTLESALQDYIKNAPARSSKAIHDLSGVIECIKEAEKRITNLITK